MPRVSDKDACFGFGVAHTPDSDDCKECKDKSPAREKKCRNLTNKSIRESSSTDEEIEKWKKERKKKN